MTTNRKYEREPSFADRVTADNIALLRTLCIFLVSLGFALWAIFSPLTHWGIK